MWIVLHPSEQMFYHPLYLLWASSTSPNTRLHVRGIQTCPLPDVCNPEKSTSFISFHRSLQSSLQLLDTVVFNVRLIVLCVVGEPYTVRGMTRHYWPTRCSSVCGADTSCCLTSIISRTPTLSKHHSVGAKTHAMFRHAGSGWGKSIFPDRHYLSSISDAERRDWDAAPHSQEEGIQRVFKYPHPFCSPSWSGPCNWL